MADFRTGRLEDKVQDYQQNDSADHCPDKTGKGRRSVGPRRLVADAHPVGDEAADKRTDNPDDDVAKEAEPRTAHDEAAEPASDTAEDDPQENVHSRSVQSQPYSWQKA